MDEIDFLNTINLTKEIPVNQYSALNLAYIGDAVFEMCVRSYIMKKGNKSVNNLHKEARGIVKAQSQAKMYHFIKEYLSEEEVLVLQRGRNAKSFTTAKNASVLDYRHATGLEALFGYLYLEQKSSRIMEIFDLCIKTPLV